jgi:hypothetical protein
MFDPFKMRDSRDREPHNAPVWVLLIGETYASAVHAQERRRPHPGMLPDVDFSRARQGRPSLLRRLAQLARPSNAPAESSDDSAGEMPYTPYIAHVTVGDSENRAPGTEAARPLAA